MQIRDYYNEQDGKISFTRQQASDFAKNVAGDFNPIHDIDAKRFCVPGDLLFSVVLSKIGLSQKMHVTFSGMVTDGIDISIPNTAEQNLTVTDDKGKAYLSVERSGESSSDTTLIEGLSHNYVSFSGKTFPHILVPLWQEQNAMINPDRPLVIYQSMLIDLDRVDISSPDLEITDSTFTVEGKRGNVCLQFCLKVDGEVVGRGEKHMVLSGLRAYDQEQVDGVVAFYNERKSGVY